MKDDIGIEVLDSIRWVWELVVVRRDELETAGCKSSLERSVVDLKGG